MAAPGSVNTNTGVDNVTCPEVLLELPTDIIACQWPQEIYRETASFSLVDSREDGAASIPLLDLEITVSSSTPGDIQFTIIGDSVSILVRFTLDQFFTCAETGWRVRTESTDDSLEDFLNSHYPLFYTSQHSVVSGNEISRTSSQFPTLDSSCLHTVTWAGVNVKSEVSDTAVGSSVHSYIRGRLLAENNRIVVYDHRKGEIADFVVMEYLGDGTLQVTFYHCKASSEVVPGIRSVDFEELGAQGIRSAYWVLPKILRKRLLQRIAEGSPFLKGNRSDVETFFEDMKSSKTIYRMVLVQPGLSKARFERQVRTVNSVKSNLSAIFFVLTKSAGFSDCTVLCSG
jgi:hypothetical protein